MVEKLKQLTPEMKKGVDEGFITNVLGYGSAEALALSHM